MKNLSNNAILLIGFSYTFLIINKIAFGFSAGLGILILLITNKSFIFEELKRFSNKIKKLDLLVFTLFLISFFYSTINSIEITRSFPVYFYLIFFLFFSAIIYLIFYRNEKSLKLLLNIFSISLLGNSSLIFIYNIANYEYSELIMFKGYMNIISLLTVLNFYFNKSKINFIALALLIPNIIMTGSASSFLGIIFGLFFVMIYYLFKKSSSSKFLKHSFFLISFSLLFFSTFIFVKNLPNKFDKESMYNFDYKIPINLIDAHRQFIWGFSFEKFKDRPYFGYGLDASNYIDGSQNEIGLELTGDMNFIPSHPHNFLVELLLETGFVGTIFFLLFLLYINFKIYNLNKSSNFHFFLIYFNGYFWGSSLVNFSFWLGWWQGSYYLLLSLLASKAIQNSKKLKPIKTSY